MMCSPRIFAEKNAPDGEYETSEDTMINVRFKKLNDTASLPAYQTSGAAAADLCACLEEPVSIGVGECVMIPTGLAMSMPRDTVALIFARSGLAVKKGISLANSVGVIDSDYRGEIKVALVNHGNEPFTVSCGDRIAQIGFFPVLPAEFSLADELDDTERGTGGFGHTGV